MFEVVYVSREAGAICIDVAIDGADGGEIENIITFEQDGGLARYGDGAWVTVRLLSRQDGISLGDAVIAHVERSLLQY